MKINFSNCHIRTPRSSDLLELYQLLAETFIPDRELFRQIIEQNKSIYTWQPYTLYRGNEILGNVSLMPINIFLAGEKTTVIGIASVVTVEKYRNMGVVKYLLKHCLDITDCENNPCVLFTDAPVVYQNLGFEPVKQKYMTAHASDFCFGSSNFQSACCETITEQQIARMGKIYENQYPNYDAKVIRDADYWQFYKMMFNPYPKSMIGFCTSGDKLLGYIRIEAENDRLLVNELVAAENACDVVLFLLNIAAECAKKLPTPLLTLALPGKHAAWQVIKEKNIKITEETGRKREIFMYHPPAAGPTRLHNMQWSLADKF